MTEQSTGTLSPRTIWLLIAVAVAAMVGVFASMVTSLAIRDLQASQQQVVEQMKALQETVSTARANVKRLSDEVAALSAKLEALQQSFASAHQQIPPPAVSAPAPTGQKRGAR